MPSPGAYEVVKISTTDGSTCRTAASNDALISASAGRVRGAAGACACARGATTSAAAITLAITVDVIRVVIAFLFVGTAFRRPDGGRPKPTPRTTYSSPPTPAGRAIPTTSTTPFRSRNVT